MTVQSAKLHGASVTFCTNTELTLNPSYPIVRPPAVEESICTVLSKVPYFVQQEHMKAIVPSLRGPDKPGIIRYSTQHTIS